MAVGTGMSLWVVVDVRRGRAGWRLGGDGMTASSGVRLGMRWHVLAAAVPLVVATALACGSDGGAEAGRSESTSTTEPEDLVMEAGDFVRLEDMTPVRGFFVDNRLGHLDEAIAVANDPGGGEYPVGTIIQLVPQEAMVKRAPGFDRDSNDWEFFSLDVTAEGTTILTRGGAEVINRFGGSCADCHSLAEPQFDFVCEQDHGCEPLPIDRSVIESVQAADPRPPSTRPA
jgi:hypothetical protein